MGKKVKVGIKIPSKNEIDKKYGSLIRMADSVTTDSLWLPSTFFALNYQYGGGIPYGKILEVMGEESSGKSLIAFNFAYATQQLGGHVIWIDAEQSWTNDWAEKNGIDLSRVTLVSCTEIEEISDIIADLSIYHRSKLTHNEPILLVVDSVAAMDCTDNVNAKMAEAKAEMGGRAKALYKMFRIRNEMLFKLGITQIYINQMRVALNVGFGKDNTTSTGGKALGFFASIRSAFYAGRSLTVKYKGVERKSGKLVTVRMIKNKVAPPRATISKAPVYFHPKYHAIGFDRCYGVEDILVENDVIDKSNGGIYKYNGETLCRGEEKFQKLLEDNDDLRRKLLKKAGINTIGTTKKQLDKIKWNMFKIEGDINYEKQSNNTEEDESENE